MKSLRKTILFLSDTLKWSDKPVNNNISGESSESPFPTESTGEAYGYKWENSKLSASYRAIKRMTYQQWQ